ncbi:MAG TPA: hypothetical protein VFE77_02965 [Rhodanobacter sp.]|nr:hypothetical protein [Rhodanobacter sp.]
MAAPVVHSSDTAPTSGSLALTAGVTGVNPGRAVRIDCTTTGVCTYVLPDRSSMVLHLTGGTVYEFNDACTSFTGWTSSGVGAFYNLY